MPAPDAASLPTGAIVRTAGPGDAAAIRQMVRAARLDPTQLRWPQFLVIERDGAIIACGQLRRFRGAQELGSLVVVPSWQGRGLGGLLVRHLIARATAPLYLECQGALVAYYARFGFTSVSWRTIPARDLRLKFALSALFSRLFRFPHGTMHYAGPPPGAPAA